MTDWRSKCSETWDNTDSKNNSHVHISVEIGSHSDAPNGGPLSIVFGMSETEGESSDKQNVQRGSHAVTIAVDRISRLVQHNGYRYRMSEYATVSFDDIRASHAQQRTAVLLAG